MESSSVVRGDERQRLIEKKAYEFYLSRGCTGGSEVDDWLAAERAVDAELSSRRKEQKEKPGPKAFAPEPAPRNPSVGGFSEKIKGKFRRVSG